VARVKEQLSATEFAVLGLLYERPMHGYDLVRRMSADLSMVLPLDGSSIYSVLRELDAQGLIVGTRETVGSRPTRTVYRITQEAEAQFLQWLAEPVTRLRQVRSDLLVKLYFCRARGPDWVTRLLDAQIATSRAYRDRLEEQIAELSPGSYERLVCESKRGPAATTITWLEQERQRAGA
jgi:DNA-binding PadR family transcriptional regulator